MSLLAKRTPPITLVRHTSDVAEAAETLFGADDKPLRLGEAWLRFFRLDSADWGRFHANLLAASLFHDWGKANNDMQGMLAAGKRGQLFRQFLVTRDPFDEFFVLAVTIQGRFPNESSTFNRKVFLCDRKRIATGSLRDLDALYRLPVGDDEMGVRAGPQ